MRSRHASLLHAWFGSRGDTRPFIHLNARQQLIAAILRSKDRSLAFFDVEPVLAQRRNDVRIVRDENGRAKRLGTAIVLVRRYDQSTAVS
jgi:hypothetical protein